MLQRNPPEETQNDTMERISSRRLILTVIKILFLRTAQITLGLVTLRIEIDSYYSYTTQDATV